MQDANYNYLYNYVFLLFANKIPITQQKILIKCKTVHRENLIKAVQINETINQNWQLFVYKKLLQHLQHFYDGGLLVNLLNQVTDYIKKLYIFFKCLQPTSVARHIFLHNHKKRSNI